LCASSVLQSLELCGLLDWSQAILFAAVAGVTVEFLPPQAKAVADDKSVVIERAIVAAATQILGSTW
jgi:hypothetical protein